MGKFGFSSENREGVERWSQNFSKKFYQKRKQVVPVGYGYGLGAYILFVWLWVLWCTGVYIGVHFWGYGFIYVYMSVSKNTVDRPVRANSEACLMIVTTAFESYMDLESEGFMLGDVMCRVSQASESTVKRTLKDLEKMGFLWKEEGGRKWFLAR